MLDVHDNTTEYDEVDLSLDHLYINPLDFCEELIAAGHPMETLVVSDGTVRGKLVRNINGDLDVLLQVTRLSTKISRTKFIDTLITRFDSDHNIIKSIIKRNDRINRPIRDIDITWSGWFNHTKLSIVYKTN